MPRDTRCVLLLCAAVASALAQGLSVSVSELQFQMTQGGPLPRVTQFTVTAPGAWTATVSNGSLATLTPRQGAGNATITITPGLSLQPGTHSGTITVSDQTSPPRTIDLRVNIEARQAAQVTYPSGPNGCSDVTGLPAGNKALCVVPNENPPGDFMPPAQGGAYTDPNFGARVRVLAGPDSLHGYSTPSPVSANNKHALLSVKGTHAVVELATGRVVRNVQTGIEGVMWDGQNENVLYYLSGATIRRYDVANNRTDTIADYSRAPHNFQRISSGGTGEISRDNWFSFSRARAPGLRLATEHADHVLRGSSGRS